MRKNKGFTLIELVGVIIVIAIVSLLVIPNILGLLQNSKQSLNERQLDMIMDAAQRYAVINHFEMSDTDPNFIHIEDLAAGGFIESEEIADLTNPSKQYNGCVMSMFSYKRQTFEYKYLDECNPEDYANKVSVSHDYVSGWVKKVNLTVSTEFKATDGSTYFKYCASSSPTCTPNKEVRKEKDTVTITNQGEHIYACAVSIADTGSQSEVKCVGPFKIDNQAPTLTIPDDENLDSLVTTYNFDTGVSYSDNFTPTNQIVLNRSGNISLGTLGSYSITYTATDLAGNVASKTRIVTVVDVTNPEITLTVNNNQFNSNGWANQDIEAKIKVTDKGGSGPESYTYCLATTNNCTPNKTVTKTDDTITISTESRTNYVCAYGTDGANNNSTPVKCIGPYKLDKTKPDAEFDAVTTIGTSVKTYSLHTGVTYKDNLSTEDELVKNISGNVSFGVSGTYTITHTITDLADNTATKTRKLKIVDDELPEIKFTVKGSPFNSNGWATKDFTINVTTSDEGDGVASYTYCTTTNATGNCTPGTKVDSTSGEITISSESATNWVCGFATDRANNNSNPVSCVGPYKLDKKGPEISFPDTTTIYQSAGTFDLKSGVTVTDNVTSSAQISLATSSNISFSQAGDYTITYTATDLAGNKTEKTRTVTIVDDIKPGLDLAQQCSNNGDNGWCKGKVTVSMDIEDSSEIIERQYKVESTGTWQTLSTTTHEINSDVNKTYYYRVKDAAGNWSEEKHIGIKRDATPPIITAPESTVISQAQSTFNVWDGVDISDNLTKTADLIKSTTGSLNFAEPADYNITYTVKDLAGNTATASRKITIEIAAFNLTVRNQKSAYGSISGTSSGPYMYKTNITITAKANQGYDFVGWAKPDGSIYSTESTLTFKMPNEDLDLTATYMFDIESIEEINVLNVYPYAGTADYFKNWMNTYGKGRINVTPVFIDDFNANPENYLGTAGNWKYHVVVFGFRDCNANKDLSAESAALTDEFINEGHGVIFGHDTITAQGCGSRTNFNTLAGHVNLTLGNRSYNVSTSVRIEKEGIFTSYPYKIGGVGTTLTIPSTHVYGQTANGDIWVKIVGDIVDDNKNFYLTTYQNTAMIQTGHTGSSATDDEQKMLTNIIFYMYSYDLMNR